MLYIYAIAAFVVLFYIYFVKPFSYWAHKGVSQKSILSIWKDSLCLILQLRPTGEIIRKYCNSFINKRYCGAYQMFSPVLYVYDPDLIKQLAIQDFDHFVDRNQPSQENENSLWAKNLLALKGDRWRDMRATLTPSFTGSKMKAMFTLISDCSKQFVNHSKNGSEINQVDMKDACTRYATDVIGSCSFGVICNSLEDRDNEFYTVAMEAFQTRGIWASLKFFLVMFSPRLAKIFGVSIFSPSVAEFFRRLVRTNIESREKNNIVRPDMIHLLMQAKNGELKHETDDLSAEEKYIVKHEKRQKWQLTYDDLTAQALIFFFAGYETSSNFMCFLFYELALNPDIQNRLRNEISATLNNCEGELTYEGLQKMKYMDMVISETLRKWPPGIILDRQCVKSYTIQPTMKGEQPIHMKPGDAIWMCVYPVHMNPKYFPNPERFDPERFSDENKAHKSNYAFVPFGLGPRSCIGNRFALLETKTLLFHVLSNFEVVVTEKTAVPIILATDQFNLFSKDGFHLGLKLKPSM